MIENYIECRNCGNYIAQDKAVNNIYCSEACANHFSVCIICGKYFVSTKGFDDTVCSKECSVAYKITKRFTNEDEETP